MVFLTSEECSTWESKLAWGQVIAMSDDEFMLITFYRFYLLSHHPHRNVKTCCKTAETKYYMLLCSIISDISAGYSTFILNAMRVALHVSLALSLNLTRDLPAGYTALNLAEGFYLATLGGAEGTYDAPLINEYLI